jgi:hypothetical protein
MGIRGLNRKPNRLFTINRRGQHFRRISRLVLHGEVPHEGCHMRVSASICLLVLTSALALAEEKSSSQVLIPGPVTASVNYTLNLPLDAADQAAEAEVERSHRRAMYAKAAKECEDLLATIAATCQITNISMSTQLNRYPGQAPTIYVNASVTMQIALKP